MSRTVSILAIILFASLLAGFASNYIGQTKTGDIIITKGKSERGKTPELDIYKNVEDNKHEINRDRIKHMFERQSINSDPLLVF